MIIANIRFRASPETRASDHHWARAVSFNFAKSYEASMKVPILLDPHEGVDEIGFGRTAWARRRE